MEIREYQNLDSKLLSDWQQLWDNSDCANFFNHPSWLIACQKTFPSDTLKVVTLYDQEKLSAVLPLCEEKKFGVRTWASPGGKHLDKTTLLAREKSPAILLSIIDFLVKSGNFYLSELDEDTMKVIKSSRQALVVRKASDNPYLSLNDDPLAFVSKKKHSKILSRIRKNQDKLSYRCYKGGMQGLDLAFEVDRQSSKRQQGKATFVSKLDKVFARQLMETYQERFTVDMLYYDNMPMVFDIGFVYKNTYLSHNTAYDKRFAWLSPRKVLFYYTACRLREEGVQVFDFSRGINRLKTDFTPFSKTQYDIYFAKNPWVGRWWKITNKIYDRLLNTGWFYKTYLVFKRMYVAARDKT